MSQSRTAWIVGASRGIGAAIAAAFGKERYRVALTARSLPDLESVGRTVKRAGAEDVLIVPASVSSTEQIEGAAALIGDRWGSLDVLVCCAGISPTFVRSEALQTEDWARIIDVNLSGVFRCCRAAFPHLKPAGGSIVNISSVHGSVAGPRLAAYAASKGGIDALTKTLAVEWAQSGIRVNGIAPGYVETTMTEGFRTNSDLRDSVLDRIPLGRFASPDEVASAALFLSDEASAYLTGAILYVDGGWTAQ